MIGGIVCWLSLFAGQAGDASWKAAVELGRFGDAWRMLELETDPLLRRRAEVEALYAAGDPAGALAFAENGLLSNPGDLELLFRAVSASIWLRAGERSRDAYERLAVAVKGAELSPDDRSAWHEALEDQRQRIETLERAEDARARAFGRARLVASLMLVLCLAGLAFLLFAFGHERRQPIDSTCDLVG